MLVRCIDYGWGAPGVCQGGIGAWKSRELPGGTAVLRGPRASSQPGLWQRGGGDGWPMLFEPQASLVAPLSPVVPRPAVGSMPFGAGGTDAWHMLYGPETVVAATSSALLAVLYRWVPASGSP